MTPHPTHRTWLDKALDLIRWSEPPGPATDPADGHLARYGITIDDHANI